MSSIHVEIPMVAKGLASSQKKPGKSAPPAMEPYKPPTPDQQMHSAANSAKVSATHAWVRGELSTKKHEEVHKRANKVLAKKKPTRTFGK